MATQRQMQAHRRTREAGNQFYSEEKLTLKPSLTNSYKQTAAHALSLAQSLSLSPFLSIAQPHSTSPPCVLAQPYGNLKPPPPHFLNFKANLIFFLLAVKQERGQHSI